MKRGRSGGQKGRGGEGGGEKEEEMEEREEQEDGEEKQKEEQEEQGERAERGGGTKRGSKSKSGRTGPGRGMQGPFRRLCGRWAAGEAESSTAW